MIRARMLIPYKNAFMTLKTENFPKHIYMLLTQILKKKRSYNIVKVFKIIFIGLKFTFC